MNTIAKYTTITVVAASTGLAAIAASADDDERRGYSDDDHRGKPCMMKHGGRHGRHADRDLNLTAEQARVLVEAKLIMRGNDRLKVGEVTEKDAETYVVNVVTLDDSLVRQIEVDRDNGLRRGRHGRKH